MREAGLQKLRRWFGFYLAFVALALVFRVGLMFATVAGVSAYTMGPGTGSQSMAGAVSTAWAGLQDAGRALNGGGGSQRVEIRSVLTLPSITDGRAGAASPPRQPGRALILHLRD
jgi:hypothetical protein